ncbi:FAD/NAD(P)-binding domain-containing protein [Mytilinidion resinicola]|uniref:FAD/NAD(P)-binding domain-containing protein n=1 Tax=Mytilinidion resinicola TaxID=574789 RepID=A0A6A6XXL4_9PEZI|nr:FAD/NAD(P)-binding domain-containing protein [Mytilinidion resinicola]KAF2801281.1 FAD/NAD(P)-binding domain-containing protein [Mytilinidion resinicola]
MAQTTPSSQKNIIILGGSYGGISSAHYILKHVIPALPSSSSYQVILVSTSTQAMCRPACPRALISDDFFDQQKLFVGITKGFEQYPTDTFRFVHGTATSLDHTSRTVSVRVAADNSSESFAYHALVIATGASTPSPLFGLNHGESFLRESWAAFRKALPTAKTIIIAGGGPAGVETAGELGEYLNGRARWFSSKLANPKVAITVVTADSKILPALRASIAAKAEAQLAKVGVTVIKNARVTNAVPIGAAAGADSVSKTTVTLSDGKTMEADLYIPATGLIPNTTFVPKELLTSNERVETSSSTLRVEKAGSRVYAVGDVSSAARPAIHILMEAIPVLCANLKRDLLLDTGKAESEVGAERTFKEDTSETQMVAIGTKKGVGAAMGWQLPSFMVWLIKGRDYWLWTTGNLWSGKQWAKET